LKSGIKVYEAMTKNPVVISPDIELPVCARKMLSNNVGALLVKNKNRLMGIITEKDIVEQAVGKELNLKRTKVKDIMSTLLIVTSPEADLMEAIQKMKREDVRRLPVVNKNKLVGLLTQKDIISMKPDLFIHLVSTIKKQKRK